MATATKNDMSQSKKTMDVHHARKLGELTRNRDRMHELDNDLALIRSAIAELTRVPKSELDDDQLSQLLDMQDREKVVLKGLEQLDTGAEVDYILNAGETLFRYYDLIENGNKNHATAPEAGDNSILKYFSLRQAPPAAPSLYTGPVASSNEDVRTDNRASLLEDYMSIVDPTYVRPDEQLHMTGIDEDNIGKCTYCHSEDRTVRLLEGFIECNACFAMEDILVDHDKPSYKEPPKEVSYFAYKRMNHLNEHLSQSQGRESTHIDDHVIDQILMELKKQKITNMMDVTAAKIKEILKKLRINKFYEHVSHILARLTGKPVAHLSPELEEQLRLMFRMIQYPFLVHAPATRKNFLSYHYVLHKSLQLLGHDEFLPSFPLLKSRDKLAQQDAIWKKICADLNWEFVPSL